MKIVMLGGGAMIAAAGVYFHGPLVTGEVYEHSASEAYEVLAGMETPYLVDKVFHDVPSFSVTKAKVLDQSVVWSFRVKGKEAASFTANILPIGDKQSRVSTSFHLSGEVDKLVSPELGLAPFGEVLGAVGKVGMTEQADSKLERREFQGEKVSDALVYVMMRHTGRIQRAGLKAMEEHDKLSEGLE